MSTGLARNGRKFSNFAESRPWYTYILDGDHTCDTVPIAPYPSPEINAAFLGMANQECF